MQDIFFSYSTQNRRKVKALVDILINCGWTVWWDQTIGAGEEWSDEIIDKLHNSKCVIIAWSRTAIKSEWVLKEAKIALNGNKILPILLEPVKIPNEFAHVQSERLTAWDGAKQTYNIEKFIHAVEKILGKSSSNVSDKYFKETVEEIERIEAAEAAIEYCTALFASMKDRNENSMERVRVGYERLQHSLSPMTDEDLHDFLERYFEEFQDVALTDL